MTLYDRVKETADKKGLSLQKTATKAGLGINSLYSWKTRKPTTERIKAVADVLDVSVDYLLGNTDDPTPVQATSQKGPAQIDLKEKIDDESVIMTFEGRPIPKEDLEIIKRLLRRD